MERSADGLTVTVPPVGFGWGRLLFLLLFVLAACAGVWLVLPTIVPPPMRNGAIVFAPFFSLAAAGVGFDALDTHVTRTVIGVRRGRLLVYRKGVFRRVRWEWASGEVQAIWSGDTAGLGGAGDAAASHHALVIEPKADAPVCLIGERTRQEQQWVATLLRDSLAVPDS